MFDPLLFIVLVVMTSTLTGVVMMRNQKIDHVSMGKAFLIVLGIPAFVIGSTVIIFYLVKHFINP